MAVVYGLLRLRQDWLGRVDLVIGVVGVHPQGLALELVRLSPVVVAVLVPSFLPKPYSYFFATF